MNTTKLSKTLIASSMAGALVFAGAAAAQETADRSERTTAANTESNQPMSDTWITTKVKAELATADGVKSTRVSVETNDGVVTLTGVLPTQTAVQKAETVARAVKGVKKVDAAGLKVKG